MWWLWFTPLVILLVIFLLTLVRIAGDTDRKQRHTMKDLLPFSDVTITKGL